MEKLRMTNNEYQEYCRKLADKVWSNENYTIKDYYADCDDPLSVYIPFLSI